MYRVVSFTTASILVCPQKVQQVSESGVQYRQTRPNCLTSSRLDHCVLDFQLETLKVTRLSVQSSSLETLSATLPSSRLCSSGPHARRAMIEQLNNRDAGGIAENPFI